MINSLQNFICLSIYSFIYLFTHAKLKFLKQLHVRHEKFFRFRFMQQCSFSRTNQQTRQKTKNSRKTSKTNYFFFFFFFFFCFRRFKSFSRKFFFTVRKQSAQKHNFIQYTHDMNNVDKNYDVSFSIRRFTENIFSLKKSLRNRQLAFCKAIQHEIIEQNREWLENTIDEHLEIFDRIKKSRYQDIRNHLLDVLQRNTFRRFDSSYFQTFHDDNDENVEANIRFYIENFRSIFEFETEEKNNIDWMFLKRFKKRKEWIMIDFFRKSFDHEMKLLKKSRTFSVISRLLQKIRSDLINIAIFRRRNTDNLCLQTLLKIIEKKNHIAIFKSQHLYIKFKMIDIRTNKFWYSIALYSIENHDMFRKCDQMIAISAIMFDIEIFNMLICDIFFKFD